MADATYTYDALGNLSTSTYRNGVATSYTYDERNRLRRMRSMKGATFVANFDYDEAGEGATPTTAPFTWADRLLSGTGQRRRTVEHYGATQRTVDYDYDSLGRLTQESVKPTVSDPATTAVDYSGTGTGMGYDAVGNRQSRQVTTGSLPGVTSYGGDTFNDRDELTTPRDTRSWWRHPLTPR